MPKELEKSYNFAKSEGDIYKKWEDSGFFNPDNLDLPIDAPAFTIILPPPNITDKLHLGHSSMLAIEDLMIRFKRMNGFRALWVPGTDHAAIATQNVVEKRLNKEKGLTRHDLGREKFLEKVWDFLRETQSMILKQTRSMGASLDWSREAFTLDEPRVRAVRKIFVDMYNEGMIYKGERIVNWCPRCGSTLADDEVEYKEQKAKFYTFKYDKNFPIEISTTRPETKLGDTAVAVNPKDNRYKDFIGKTYQVDFLGVKLNIKIVADWKIDMNFGTGALGVTPAHSQVDWQMAEENNLEIIKVINEKGKIYDGFGDFSGLDVVEARGKIVEDLKKQGLLVKEEEIDNNLSICYRCDTAIEPLPSKQWFVSVDKKLERLGGKSIKEKSIEVAEMEEVKFVPYRFTKRYLDWMSNLHDWCISRQIWFGHRIPAWYCDDCGGITVSETDPAKCAKCNSAKIRQDEDSLDTWFSSGMWTFSTLGWPDNFKNGVKTGDLKKFHPTQVLETGYEIITLWVSRMIMMSLFAIGEIPFENVYLHGMVLDKNGKKMSKSKGNGIDPLDMILKYGTDAVRLSLLIGNTPGNDVRVSEEKIEGLRNFVNKLWNISRFILSMEVEDSNDVFVEENKAKLTTSDKWIVAKMHTLITEVTVDIEQYDFSHAGDKLREFSRNDLADWYIEASKFSNSEVSAQLLRELLKDLLRLWHPYLPFVTENIWSHFNDQLLMVDEWPKASKYKLLLDNKRADSFEIVKDVIIAIRNARAENKVEPGRKIEVEIHTKNNEQLILNNSNLITSMRTGVEKLSLKTVGDKPQDSIAIAMKDIDIYLIGAVDKEREKQRIEKEIQNLQKMVGSIEGKLANQSFVDNAPTAIVEREQARLLEYKNTLLKLEGQLRDL